MDCPTSRVEKESEHIQQMYKMDEKQTASKVTDTYDSLNRIKLINETVVDHLKLVEVKNGSTTVFPLNIEIGGQDRNIKDKVAICLTKDQARYIYKGIIQKHS